MKRIPALILAAVFLCSWFAMPIYADPLGAGAVEGYFKSARLIEGVTLVELEDYSGNTIRLQLAEGAELSIDQRKTAISSFKNNMEIYAEMDGDEITLLEGYSTVNPGYVAPGARQRQGVITVIERDQLQITLDKGQTLTCFTGPGTLVTKYGTQSSLSDMVVGDHVKLYFDEADATSCVIFDANTLAEYSIVTRIEVMNESGQIADVFKGELVSVDRIKPLLTFKDVKVLKNGIWSDYQSSLQMTYNEDNPIYLGGQEISARNLKYYAGKDVFWANRAVLANSTLSNHDTIEKMVIKGQYSMVFTDKIEDINWYNTSFELASNQNILFHPGSIILKDGRMQSSSALALGQDVMVVADGNNGAYSAAVIIILNDSVPANNSSLRMIYDGKLVMAAENQIILSDYYWLKDNEWLSFTEEKPFFYDEETAIYVYDSVKGKLVALDADEFVAGNYAVNEDSSYAEDNNLKDYYAYVYADGDRAVAIMLQPNLDTLLVQRITTARLSQVENHATLGWRFLLKDSADWSVRQGQWISRTGELNVTLNKALIIKNNRIITSDELKSNLNGSLASGLKLNDRLYIVRNDIEARIILVR